MSSAYHFAGFLKGIKWFQVVGDVDVVISL